MGRYRVIQALVEGGAHDVHLAEDEALADRVVIKRSRSTRPDALARARREAVALRLLRAPGVVTLRDAGEDEAGAFLVTEWVDGQPFPGGVPREELPRLSVRLLEVLTRIHAAGVVHRDLKPSNVLVDGSGSPWVLDFGVAHGAPLGDADARTAPGIGTPRYMAPEQVAGDRVDARADLYAVGLMLHEALAGAPPFPGADGVHARVWRDVPSVGPLAPDAPEALVRLVDRLCARLPEERPRSATAALALLGHAPPAPWLAWIGDRVGVDRLVAAALRGVAMDVAGPRGAGRSRTLEEAAQVLRAKGRSVRWLPPGSRPLASLRQALGVAEELEPAALRARAEAWMAEGGVLVVDPPDGPDSWSLTALGEMEGAILGLGAACIRVGPLAEDTLRELFFGPDRVLHLREDAARALHRLTDGLAGRVVAAIGAWTERGLATLEAGRVRVSPAHVGSLSEVRIVDAGDPPEEPGLAALWTWIALAEGELDAASLARLTKRPSWEVALRIEELTAKGNVEVRGGRLRARGVMSASGEDLRARHAALAGVLPPGGVRLRHLILGDVVEEVAAHAGTLAGDLVRDGRFGAACHLLDAGVSAVRGRVAASVELPLLGAFVVAAHAGEDTRWREAASRAVERSAADRRGAGWLLDLAQASAALGRRHLDVAEGLLADLEPVADPALELCRGTLLVEARVRARPAEASAELERWADWAAADPERKGRWHGWCGMEAYRTTRFADAAAHHAKAAELRTHPYGRLVSDVNAAGAWLEVPDLERARAAARRAVVRATQLRLAALELKAWTVLRGADYRAGRADTVDLELVDAAERLESLGSAAHHLLLEGTVAWRAGDAATAERLLAGARSRYAGFAAGLLTVDVLRATVPGAPRQSADWAGRLAPWAGTRLGAQLHAVLRRAGLDAGQPPPEFPFDVDDPDLRLEVLSVREIRSATRAAARIQELR